MISFLDFINEQRNLMRVSPTELRRMVRVASQESGIRSEEEMRLARMIYPRASKKRPTGWYKYINPEPSNEKEELE